MEENGKEKSRKIKKDEKDTGKRGMKEKGN